MKQQQPVQYSIERVKQRKPIEFPQETIKQVSLFILILINYFLSRLLFQQALKLKKLLLQLFQSL